MIGPLPESFQFFVPTRVIQGAGRCQTFEGVEPLPLVRPLIVTGSKSALSLGYVEQVRQHFAAAPIFGGIEENPGTESCERGAACARENEVDGVIALGGGSAIDAAKAIAFLAVNDGRCADYFGSSLSARHALPLLAIPTTAGTGSEVTPYAVLVDGSTGEKSTLSHPSLFPKVALLDPLLTLSMPAEITLATGLDVLSQAMEGVVSRKATPITDLLALETCRIVREWLPRVVRDPLDAEARSTMQYAAMLSGMVVAHTGTTLVHGMGYRWTTECGLAHGFANASLLKPLFAYTAAHAPERVGAVAEALGRPGGPPDQSISDALDRIFEALGFSPAASNRIARKPDLLKWAEGIAENPYRLKNQRGNPGLEAIADFYEQAWSGV